MNQILRFLPALRVHSWGGFGSQLFTAYVVLKLKRRFPNRPIKVVVHTSGVTRRVSEFDFETLGVKIIQVEDYKSPKGQNSVYKPRMHFFYNVPIVMRRYIFRILKWLRFVQSANTDPSFNLISPWTLSIRGHYTRLAFDRLIVESLYHVIFPTESHYIAQKETLVIHYRLGDLLHLGEKWPINPKRVEGALKTFRAYSKYPILLSDSREEELTEFFENSTILRFSKPLNYSPIKTLRICIEAESFVGTGAKISLWAAVFRYFVYEKESSLPTELKWTGVNGLKAIWY